MFKRWIFALLAACGLLLIATQAGAQHPSSPKARTPPTVPIITANVRNVLVPVLVTNKHGHPISNLQRSDFTVFEDGVPQQIIAFSKTYSTSLDLSARASNGNASANFRSTLRRMGPDSPIRNYLICVDTLHSNFGDVVQARRGLTKFFRKEHDPKAQYALMILGRNIEVIQDATRDPSAILSALKSKKFQSGIIDGEASNIASQEEQLQRMVAGTPTTACSPRFACMALKRRVRWFIDKSANRTALLTRDFLRELTAIINAMASMPTERTLILISDGFTLAPGEELYSIASAYFPDDLEFRINPRQTQPMLDRILQLAEKDNVVVYGLDSRGVPTLNSAENLDASHHGDPNQQSVGAVQQMILNEGAIAYQNGSALSQLASATGGIYFENQNRLLPGLQRAFNDERVRYLIAYSPSNQTADGQYRKIRVAVKGKKLRVYAKAGYWAPGGQSRAGEPEMTH
ncbi:MAG: VWA domain-containing protein [Terriglobia bacterium]